MPQPMDVCPACGCSTKEPKVTKLPSGFFVEIVHDNVRCAECNAVLPKGVMAHANFTSNTSSMLTLDGALIEVRRISHGPSIVGTIFSAKEPSE